MDILLMLVPYDGITFNNTYRFEKYYDWSGVNIEPIRVFETLVQNRPKSLNLNVAISDTETISTFIESEARYGIRIS